jgi:hypothetical protein
MGILDALRQFLPPEQKLRHDIKKSLGMSDEKIDEMGGPVRVAQLFLVLQRATELACSGGFTFGQAVDEAARVEGVEMATHESQWLVLATARATMAIKDEEKRGG